MRWIIWIFGGVMLLLVAAALVITLLVDPNRFKGPIEAAVRDATGRPFEIGGDLDIGWFPWLAMRTGAARLGNPPGVSGPPLIEWAAARVGVKLIPLIRGTMVVDRVLLERPRIYLHRSSQGLANWTEVPPASTEDRVANGERSSAPQVAGLEIRDGMLELLDEQSGTHVRLTDWNLEAGAWREGATLPFRTDFVLETFPGSDVLAEEGSPPLRIETETSAEAHIAAGFEAIALADLLLEARVRGGGVAERGVPIEIRVPQLVVRTTPLSVSAPQLTGHVANAELTGGISTEGENEHFQMQGPLTLEVPSLRRLLRDVGVEAALPEDEQALGALELSAQWTFADGAINVKPLRIRIDETQLTGEIVRPEGGEGVWHLDLRGDHIDLGRYLKTEETTDEEPFELPVEALRQLPVRGVIAFRQASLDDTRMTDLKLRLNLESDEHEGTQ